MCGMALGPSCRPSITMALCVQADTAQRIRQFIEDAAPGLRPIASGIGGGHGFIYALDGEATQLQVCRARSLEVYYRL